MSIKIDASKCIGCGACVSACPKCFEMDGTISKVKDEDCVCDDCDVREVAEACPGGAISVD